MFEETGVRAEFVGFAGVRHMHNYRFARGDLYFLSILKPITTEIKMDKNEISKCKWFSVWKSSLSNASVYNYFCLNVV